MTLQGQMSEATDPFSAPTSIKVVYEVFSLPLKNAASMRRGRLPDAKIYERIVADLSVGAAKQEAFLVARGVPEMKILASQGTMYRYPTEFDPAELPNQVDGPISRKTKEGEELTVFPVTPSNPTTYESRLLGKSIELYAKLKEGDRVTLSVTPKSETLVGKDTYGYGVAKQELPRFAAPVLGTSVTVAAGRPFLLGTISPPLEQQPKEGETVTHLAFVTVTLVKHAKDSPKK